jgi:hypothetical protein
MPPSDTSIKTGELGPGVMLPGSLLISGFSPIGNFSDATESEVKALTNLKAVRLLLYRLWGWPLGSSKGSHKRG